LEFAEQNPTSYVVGTDLSKIQPDRLLANCEFIQDDAEDEWFYQYKFDLIHFRMVVSCFTEPQMVLNHAIKALNPGGWIEYQDMCMDTFSSDGSHKSESTVVYCGFNKF
jgi:SAM-dependent methyltransferase